MKISQNTLTLPPNIGRTIVRKSALIACPLLGTDKFIKFCKERSLPLNRKRLIGLERLGLLAPVYRVPRPPRAKRSFVLLSIKENDWFRKGWAWDTTSIQDSHTVPDTKDQNQEGYYSIFQLAHLDFILNSMTLSVHMDGFLETKETRDIDWNKNGKKWMEIFEDSANMLREHEHRRSRALLCQFISNRYYPYTQSDQRTGKVSVKLYVDRWIIVNPMNWDWEEYARCWKPRQTEKLFQLTAEKLRRAYEGLAVMQESCDPMARWYQLIQFIPIRERNKLKGNALKAEALRTGAHMLRLLYKDLYGDNLPHPNEVTGTIINHVPELEVRRDTRRYLEFVANRYGVNPQPKLCLLVEGPSEELVIQRIFDSYFGAHPGKFGIEIIPLGSVDNATGGRQDRYRAILRLVDYLHHNQTFTFLILDNENYAKRLKNAAKEAKSIHGIRRYVTRGEYIKIWRQSFELDNFSATEVAAALSVVAQDRACFTRSEVITCTKDKNPNARLSELYKKKTGGGLSKLKLAEQLVNRMLDKKSQRKINNRPLVKTLERVTKLAARNPFPTMLDVWERNQSSKLLSKRGR